MDDIKDSRVVNNSGYKHKRISFDNYEDLYVNPEYSERMSEIQAQAEEYAQKYIKDGEVDYEALKKDKYDILIVNYLLSPVNGDKIVELVREFDKEIYIICI